MGKIERKRKSEISVLTMDTLELLTGFKGAKIVNFYTPYENYTIYIEFNNGQLLKFEPDSIGGVRVSELTIEEFELGY